MKKSKIAVALVLVLLLVIQSMSVFADTTINLGDFFTLWDSLYISGNTLVTDHPAVGQSVYFDISDDSNWSFNAEINDWSLRSVVDSVYTYRLPDILYPSKFDSDVSVTAKVYDSSAGFTGVEATKVYPFASIQPSLNYIWIDTTYNNVRSTVYGNVYENNARISMPFNTIADDYNIYFGNNGRSIYVNGQDLSINPYLDLQPSADDATKCEPVSVSVYRSVYRSDYNLDVYLNTPGTATVSDINLKYPDNSASQASPDYISGSVSDPDSGNVGINGVQFTLQNSDGKYLVYDDVQENFSVTTATYAVYNNAYMYYGIYDSDFTRSWDIVIDDGYKLPDSKYTLSVYADDGKLGAPKTSTFTVGTSTPVDPVPPVTGGSTPVTPTQQEPTIGPGGTIIVPEAKPDDKGNTVIPLTAGTLKKAIEQAVPGADGVKVIKIELPKAEGTDAYLPELPAEMLTSSAANTQFEISTEFGTVVIPANMLKDTDLKGAAKIGLSIDLADTSKLPDDIKAKIGKNPVIDLKVLADGKDLSWNNSSAPVKVTVPYTLTAQETLNPELLTVWYIDGKGNAVPVPSAKYDPALKAVTFTTTHFSQYALVYNETSFSDISNSFAKKSIEVLAAKGIISGVGNGQFSPSANITRADFLVMLVKALGLNAKFDSNFSDVDSKDYFYNAVGIAKQLGIVSGTGNNKFNPGENITRQDMMVIAAKAMKLAGKSVSAGLDLSKFTDASNIATYAKDSVSALVASNIVSGSGSAIMPTGNATREQVASIIYKIYNK